MQTYSQESEFGVCAEEFCISVCMKKIHMEQKIMDILVGNYLKHCIYFLYSVYIRCNIRGIVCNIFGYTTAHNIQIIFVCDSLSPIPHITPGIRIHRYIHVEDSCAWNVPYSMYIYLPTYSLYIYLHTIYCSL